MPLFKKSAPEMESLSDRYAKVLQRCRMLLLKDADVTHLLDALSADEGFKADVRESIAAQPTQAQRMGMLLDRLEARGNKAFGLFMESLKEHHRHIHSVLEETLKNIHDIDDRGHRDRTSLPGDMVRKLVKGFMKKRDSEIEEEQEHYDVNLDDDDHDLYLDCYSIPLKGIQSRESWIKHDCVEAEDSGDAMTNDDSTYMAMLVKATVFKKVDLVNIPHTVKMPPKYCQIFVMDPDQKLPAKTEPKPEVPRRNRSAKISNLDQSVLPPDSMVTVKDIPPPVPPKPENLPPLSPKPPVLRVRPGSRRKSRKEKPKLPPKPVLPLRQGSLSEVKEKLDEKHETEDDDDDDDDDTETASSSEDSDDTPSPEDDHIPALPPRRMSTKASEDVPKDEDSIVNPDTEGVRSNRSSCASLRQFSSRPLSFVAEESNDKVIIIEADNNNEKVIPINGIPEVIINGGVDIDYFDDIEQESYEPISPPIHGSKRQSTNIETFIATEEKKDNRENADDQGDLECQIPIGSLEDNLDAGDDEEDDEDDVDDVKEDSAELSVIPEKPVTISDESKINTDSPGENASPGSAMNGSNTTDSGAEFTSSQVTSASLEDVPLPTRRGSKPPHMLPRSVLESAMNSEIKESSEDHSYYEDIENIYMMVASSPSPPSQTPSYLDPKSYAKALEHAVSSSVMGQRDKIVPEWIHFENADRIMLRQGEMLISESQTAVNETPEESPDSLSESERKVIGLYRGTFLTFDKLGRVFYVPRHLLKRHGDPEGEPWFFPVEITSRQAALFLLQVRQEGTFLVYRPRNKSSGALYNLSVCRAGNDVVHYHIKRNVHGDVMVEGHDQSFMNICELVQYFQRNKSRLATRLRRAMKEAHLPVTPGYHYPARWEIHRANLSLTGQIIGKGQFGVVCAGIYKRYPVAVKVLQKSDTRLSEEDDFIDEARMLMGLKHEHVVRFVGVSCTAKPFFLITEYVSRGNLRDNLRSESLNTDIDTLFDLCIQVTSAIAYLESRRFLLHRDIAARNCLVTDDMCVKLADFGRAVYVTDDNYMASKSEKIAVKWAAPEVLEDSMYSSKSDVWALGILYWEVFSMGARPYPSLSAEQTAIYVMEGGHLEKPPGCSHDLYAIMTTCWHQLARDRPSAVVLYERMKSKSNIYYGPVRPISGASESGSAKATTPISGKSVVGSTPSTLKKSPTKKVATSPTRPTDEVARELIEKLRETHLNGTGKGSRERLPTSSSETSLISTAGTQKDDMSRGDKIRKSLRKIMNTKSKRKANSQHLSQSASPSPGSRDVRTLPTGQYFV